MKQIYFLTTILLLTGFNLIAQQTYTATSPALNTPVNEFAIHFNTGVIPENSTVILTLEVSQNTRNDNRDHIWKKDSNLLTGLGNAYPIYGANLPATVDYDISSVAAGHDLSVEEIIFSTNAWNANVKKPFVYGTITFSNITLNVTPPSLDIQEYQGTHVDINVYPNPASHFIKISGLDKPEQYTLFNILGAKITNGSISNNQKIDIQNLTSGLYFLKFENGNTLKFLKK